MTDLAERPNTDQTNTCPDWCVATHNSDTNFHLQADKAVVDIYGKNVEVSDEGSGLAGIYVGDREFRRDQLDELKSAIAAAERVLP